MHITLDRQTFLEHLELVGKVSTKHVTLPILQCVLLTVADDVLTITATNLEIGIEATMEPKVTAPGVVAVPSNTLLATVQFMTHKEITLRVDGTVLVVEGTGSKTDIKTIPFDEFPTIPRISGTGQVSNRSLFSLGIKTAGFAASLSSIKPELGSVCVLQKKEHTLTFVATDSFRLMEKTVPQKGVALTDPLLIPQKNAFELARVCDALTSDPELRVNENQCSLTFKHVYITSRLVGGSFPDYQSIIPKEYCTHTTLLKNDLMHAFKKTNIFLNKFLQVGVAVDNKACTIAAMSGELGTTTEVIQATTEGEALSLNFNQRYLAEPLSYVTDESIVLHFAGIGRPMVMEGVHDSTLRYLVMPMNK